VAAKIGAGSGGAISRRMRKVQKLLDNDDRLNLMLARAEGRIDKIRQSTCNLQKERVGAK
jgi:hypothetical protein